MSRFNKVSKMFYSSARMLVAVLFAASLIACTGQFAPGTGGGDDDDSTPISPPDAGAVVPPPPPPPPPPITTATYVRGSIPPVYQLTPRNEYGRMAHKGISMADADFTSNQVTTSTSLKMDEITAQINAEHPNATPVNILSRPEDRQRADFIPFRGNPSDVKHFFDQATGLNKLYVPLGGDLTAPGNEIAVVNINGNNFNLSTRVRVGIRPKRVAVHPAGLIFVCNQNSNYISVIDPRTDTILTNAGQPVEIPTEYYCADLVFAPRSLVAPDNNEQFLFVANRFRHTVLMYSVDTVLDPLNNRPVGFTHELVKEITGVGMNPHKLSLSERQDAVFVVSNRGGEVARISIANKALTGHFNAGSPALDIVNIADQVFIPTITPDRGLLARDEVQKPQQVLSQPIVMNGVDGQPHVANPGAIFDGSRSYNFEDLRNGLLQADFTLSGQSIYYTDNISSEPNYANEQKVLAGADPQAIARNAAGTRLFVAMGGSGIIQELAVNTAIRPFSVTEIPGAVFQTRERPSSISVDEQAGRLYVSTWGGEVLDVFSLANRQKIASIDLGYAQPTYPATNIERGEFFFYDASWSNNGRKDCTQCHEDELVADGTGYSNGVTTPTAYHQVKPNYNLLTSDAYFWNGAFKDGDYTSVAFAAQVRDNCELIAFALIEGPGKAAAQRVGDPNNVVTDGNDAACRPQAAGADRLPQNFAQIQQVIAAQKLVGKQHVQDATGFANDDVIRFIDFYSVAEIRVAPNPLTHLAKWGELDSETANKITRGAEVFKDAGCGSCHDPDNSRAPYTDAKQHGAGADWANRFIATYQNDARVFQQLGPAGFPQKFLDSVSNSTNDTAINLQVDPLDYFVPFCFDVTNCLQFDDPLSVIGNFAEESRRLSLIIAINLGDPDRQFMPGNVRGSAAMNTPSLRNAWQQPALLHHGYAHSIREAILPPGHKALRAGELGFAVANSGSFDNHGALSGASVEDVEAIEAFVLSIE